MTPRLRLTLSAPLRASALSAALVLLPAPPAVHAAGDILVAPTRLVFDGRTRTEELSLVNRGAERATFRISFEAKRMTRDGQFETIAAPTPEDRTAEPMLRASQREITLEPGQPQTIRVLLRKPETVAEGEYRSHLLFRAVPAATEPASASAPPGDALQINLTPIYGVSIPVIVRHGALSAEVSIADAQLTPAAERGAGGVLDVTLARTGARSVYGDLLVLPQGTPAQTESAPLFRIRGLAIYTPNAERALRVPLPEPVWAQLRSRPVKVVFREGGPAATAVLAERDL